MMKRFNLPGTLFIVALIVVWQIAAIRIDNNFVLPRATAVFKVLVTDYANILEAIWNTLRRAAIGFAIALGIMLPLGIVLGRVRVLGDLVVPVLEFLRPLPPIAIVPLAMMLLGIGDEAKLVVIVFGASFPIVINAVDAVRVQDPMQARVARSLRLTTLERMALVDLPAALPRIVAGVRISIVVSVLLTVVSELIISTNGIGDYLRLAQSDFNMTKVMAAIIVIAVLGLLVNILTNRVVRKLLDWNFRRTSLAGM